MVVLKNENEKGMDINIHLNPANPINQTFELIILKEMSSF